MARGYVETDAGREPLPDRIKAGYYSRLNIRRLSPAEYREQVKKLVEFFEQLEKTNRCKTTASPITDACKGGTVVDKSQPTSGKEEGTKQADPLADIGLETTFIINPVLQTGHTVTDESPPTSAKDEGTKQADPLTDIGLETTFIINHVLQTAVGNGHDEDPRTESEGQVEDTQQADPTPGIGLETTITDNVLQTGGVTEVDEGPPSSAKDGGTKEADPPDIGLATALINTGDIVLQTEVNKFSSFAAAKALLVIISLMIVDCSAMPLPPASCSAGICAVGEPTSVTCLFGRNILTSSHGVSVQSFSFNSTKKDPGKDALVCSWQNNVQDCFVEDGYTFNSIISDRLTLQIPVATREIAGVYKCHVASEDSPPRSCILNVTERQESTPFPTKTNGTTGKATSTTAEASKTMGPGYSVIVISLGVFAVVAAVAASALLHLLFYKRLKSRFNLAENASGQNMGGTVDEAKEILPKNRH